MASYPSTVTLARIKDAVEFHYQVRLSVRSNEARYVLARQVAWYLARLLTMRSTPEIGRYLGNGYHHTTVQHGLAAIEKKMRRHADLAAEVRLLVRELEPPAPERCRQLAGDVDLSGEWAI